MSTKTPTPDWSGDWQALQKQYWNAWTDLMRSQGAGTPDPATPWHEGLEQWARMFGSAGKQSEAAERLMASAKHYLALMQSMLSFAAGKDTGALNPSSWLDAMRNGLSMPGADTLQGAFGMPGGFAMPSGFGMPGFDASLLDNPMAKALREIAGKGVQSFEQLASGAFAPGVFEQFQKEGLSWLQAPAFGYTREHQEHYQKMALAFVDFQEALRKYNALILKSSQRAFQILESKVAERAEPGRQIDSMRALYDLWVDAAEEAYAEVALSDEFRQVYGDVVNSQMRVRSQLQQEVERIGVDLGMPTRTELNSVHKRLHDLRRELRDAQEAQRNGGNDGIDAEMAALRAELDDLRRLVINSEPASPRRAPAASAAGAAAKRTRAKRKPRAKAKRAAAKRAHVAAKSTAVEPAPAAPAPESAPERKPIARHAARVATNKRSAPARAAASASAQNPAAVSFGDAIAAMRREMAAAPPRKRKAARVSQPTRRSPRLDRAPRSR